MTNVTITQCGEHSQQASKRVKNNSFSGYAWLINPSSVLLGKTTGQKKEAGGGGNHQRDYQAGLFLGFQLLATRLAHRGGQHMACGD